ncbi:hypothetical protein [Mesorhizobium amorphae]|uniref:hypothetical protein n=1 Tax=Mesorhizobium amorphae TaxID=71433 RepID=UPI001AEED26E|nr:hypothetical protein [Mesorhizobium amorphae]
MHALSLAASRNEVRNRTISGAVDPWRSNYIGLRRQTYCQGFHMCMAAFSCSEASIVGRRGAARLRHEPLLVHAFLRARHMSKPAGDSFDAIIAAVRAWSHDEELPK